MCAELTVVKVTTYMIKAMSNGISNTRHLVDTESHIAYFHVSVINPPHSFHGIAGLIKFI